MARWKLLRGWTAGAIRDGLEEARGLQPSVSEPWEGLTLDRGWIHVASQAVIARERPGAPTPGGAFTRAIRLVTTLQFSDPRIVIAHFDEQDPLPGRSVLLEVQALGLHFLCPVRMDEAGAEDTPAEARSGCGLSTLKGHIERGRERFLLSKDLATGEVRFQISARWRAGDFPNGWSRLGFHLLGRRYQRAWHRLAHSRLRRLLREGAGTGVHGGGLRHEGPGLEDAPIQWIAQGGQKARKIDEQEDGHMRQDARCWSELGLSALSGFRSFTPLAVMAMAGTRAGRPLLLPGITRRLRPAALDALALGELAADKTPWIPARTQPPALVGRALSGSLIGASFGVRRDRRWLGPALLGAAAAVVGTYVSHQLRERARRATGLPGAALGLLEDAVVIGASSALATRIV